MTTNAQKQKLHRTFIDKGVNSRGTLFAGTKTTGALCRPACPARKQKFENYELYKTAQEVLLASFKLCMRCRPLSHPGQILDLVHALVNAVKADPSRRWKNRGLEELSADASCRQFKKDLGWCLLHARKQDGWALR